MKDTRHKDENWILRPGLLGEVSYPLVHAALLMDIRDELKTLNATFNCFRFQGIPTTLYSISNGVAGLAKAMTKKKRKRTVKNG